jgi:hypothetical protein
MTVSEITVQDIAFYLKLDFNSLSQQEIAELQVMLGSAKHFLTEYTGLSQANLDNHEDFVIAVYVLCQDMYDTRTMYVEKPNENKVVETILKMHSVNLL